MMPEVFFRFHYILRRTRLAKVATQPAPRIRAARSTSPGRRKGGATLLSRNSAGTTNPVSTEMRRQVLDETLSMAGTRIRQVADRAPAIAMVARKWRSPCRVAGEPMGSVPKVPCAD